MTSWAEQILAIAEDASRQARTLRYLADLAQKIEEDRISIDDFAQTCAFYGEQPWWGAQHIKMIGLEAARRSRAQASLKGERTAGEA